MINAETGSGKTAAVLAAILSRKEQNERIIIFTKMLSQMDAWFRELGLINDYNKKLKNKTYSMLPLIGKINICPIVSKETRNQFSQIGCSLFECQAQKAYYTLQKISVDASLLGEKIIQEIKNSIKRDVTLAEILWLLQNKIEKISCPYLAIKAAIEKAEIIITTYPFMIYPNLYEILLKDYNDTITNTTIVIDEAHNLAKGVFDEISYKILDKACHEMGSHPILDELKVLKRKKGLHQLEFEEGLLEDLEDRGRQYLLWKYDSGSQDICYTLKICDFLKYSSFCYLTVEEKFTLYLKDPRIILNHINNAKQLILISGTFRPLNDFADFLGIPQAQKLTISSEKLGRNRLILTTTDPKLTMKYQARSSELFLYYSEVIMELAKIIPGHLLVFAPNYEISIILANLVKTKFFEKPNQDISKLINEVKASKEKVIILAPSRGKISEGIEFVEEEKSLISAVVVAGLPFPPPSNALKEIIKVYSKFWGEEKANNFMSYLQAVVTMRQCLGRMIRSENDVGAWIILDNRVNSMDIFHRMIACKDTQQMVERLFFFYHEHGLL